MSEVVASEGLAMVSAPSILPPGRALVAASEIAIQTPAHAAGVFNWKQYGC